MVVVVVGQKAWIAPVPVDHWTLHNGKVGGHVSTFLKMKVEVR